MDTEKKYGLKKPKAILLFIQMILTLLVLAASVYLLVFVSKNGLGGWMISSYVFIILSILAVVFYSVYGYKKGEIFYYACVAPFLVAVFVNVILPGRTPFQVGALSVLLALLFGFLLRQKDKKVAMTLSFLAVVAALVFSIYSEATADVSFLGDVGKNWPTYFSMYLSIFIPTIMSGTLALTYNVRTTK